MMLRVIALLLACLLSPVAAAGLVRSDFVDPSATTQETSSAVGAERVDYLGNDFAGLSDALATTFAEFREHLGGVTFGVDGSTLQPVAFEGDVEAAVMDMIRKAPQLAENVEKEGGLLTAIFEFRPRLQPANANVYVRASYIAKTQQFELRRIIDPPQAAERADATGMNVDIRVELP